MRIKIHQRLWSEMKRNLITLMTISKHQLLLFLIEYKQITRNTINFAVSSDPEIYHILQPREHVRKNVLINFLKNPSSTQLSYAHFLLNKHGNYEALIQVNRSDTKVDSSVSTRADQRNILRY